MMVQLKRGFSLVEVLVFISILATFFVVAIAITVATVRNTKINEHKIIATRYAEELNEWLRAQKDADFTTFAAKDTGSGTYYCFNTNPIDTTWPSSIGDPDASCPFTGLTPAIFKRYVKLTKSGSPASSVQVDITVSWQDVGVTYTVPVNTYMTVFE